LSTSSTIDWMNPASCAAFVLACLLFIAPDARARKEQVYRYEDERGVKHYVQNPAQVPERYRDTIKKVETELSIEEGKRELGLSKDLKEYLPGLKTFEQPDSPPMIVMVELFRSRLIVTITGSVMLMLALLLGMVLARGVPDKKERRRMLIVMPASVLASMVFMWLAFTGPQLVRFARGCARDARNALYDEKLNVAEREQLENFRRSAVSLGAVASKAVLESQLRY